MNKIKKEFYDRFLKSTPEKELKKAHNKIFSDFIVYMSSDAVRTKLKTADDLLLELMYMHMQSPDGLNTGRVTIRKLINNPKYDCMINMEFQEFNNKRCFVEIKYHNKGCKLNDLCSWVNENGN